MLATQFAQTAASHRRLAATADTTAERTHWELEAERFEQLAKLAEADPTEARRVYRPTVAYEPQPAADVRSRAADIIEPHIDGNFKRRERAEGCADDLYRADLLAGGYAKGSAPIREQAVNVMQCRLEWKTAELIAAELADAGLLKGE